LKDDLERVEDCEDVATVGKAKAGVDSGEGYKALFWLRRIRFGLRVTHLDDRGKLIEQCWVGRFGIKK